MKTLDGHRISVVFPSFEFLLLCSSSLASPSFFPWEGREQYCSIFETWVFLFVKRDTLDIFQMEPTKKTKNIWEK